MKAEGKMKKFLKRKICNNIHKLFSNIFVYFSENVYFCIKLEKYE